MDKDIITEAINKAFEAPMHAMMYIMLALLSIITIVLFLKETGFHWEKGVGFKFKPRTAAAPAVVDPNAECPYTKTHDETIRAVKAVEAKVDKISGDLKDIVIDQQKQIFVDEKQSPEERLIAGLRYLYHGQNGALKTQMLRFIAEHPDVYRTIIKLKPELAVRGIGLVGADTSHGGVK